LDGGVEEGAGTGAGGVLATGGGVALGLVGDPPDPLLQSVAATVRARRQITRVYGFMGVLQVMTGSPNPFRGNGRLVPPAVN
jgi:hypothetical protein